MGISTKQRRDQESLLLLGRTVWKKVPETGTHVQNEAAASDSLP